MLLLGDHNAYLCMQEVLDILVFLEGFNNGCENRREDREKVSSILLIEIECFNLHGIY